MNIIIDELMAGMPDSRQMVRLVIRMLLAMLLGAIVGLQREHKGKPAGIKTHMLVALGAALIVLAPQESGMSSDDLSRIIQGLVTGIGFLGGGAILKLPQAREIEGLTTAAGIWMTAAVGAAVGLGRLGLAIMSMLLTWVILSLVGKIEHRMNEKQARKAEENTVPRA